MSRGLWMILFAVLVAGNEVLDAPTWWNVAGMLIIGLVWIAEDRDNRRKR